MRAKMRMSLWWSASIALVLGFILPLVGPTATVYAANEEYGYNQDGDPGHLPDAIIISGGTFGIEAQQLQRTINTSNYEGVINVTVQPNKPPCKVSMLINVNDNNIAVGEVERAYVYQDILTECNSPVLVPLGTINIATRAAACEGERDPAAAEGQEDVCEAPDANNPPGDNCPIAEGTDFRWAVCPAFIFLGGFTNTLDYFINQYLQTGNKIFTPAAEGGQKESFYKGWTTFRNFGLALVVIAGLVMLITEALGLAIVDAYTVRKVLPRLFIAVIGISLSWELTRFLIGLFDDLGQAIGSIIYSTLAPGDDGIEIWSLFFGFLITGGVATGAAILMGGAGILSLIGTLLMAMLVGAAVLLIRQAIIIAAVLLSPLAIAAYILPNTSKFANFWWDTLIRMLMLYPIANGLIALCKCMGKITMSNPGGAPGENAAIGQLIAAITGILFFFAGYALLPLAFRLTGGLVATLGGIANDRSRGAFDGLKNFRRQQMSNRATAAKEGRGGFVGANMLGAGMRRATLPGGLSPFSRGRANFRAASKQMTRGVADEALKNDNGFASGNDDANALATQEGMTRGRFVNDYAQMQMAANPGMSKAVATRQAQDALAEMEKGYGAQMGSDAMRVTAFKARAASNKGYNFGSAEENYRAAFTDAASLVNSGLMNVSDAAAVIKSNRNRSDFSGIGFGAAMSQISNTADLMRNGVTDHRALVTDRDAEVLADDVLDGSSPSAIMQGRHESVQALAKHIRRRTTRAAVKSQTYQDPSYLDINNSHVANMHDESQRSSVMVQEAWATVMEAPVYQINHEGHNEEVTMRASMETSRSRGESRGGHQVFHARRREHSGGGGGDGAQRDADEAARRAQEQAYQDQQNGH